MERESENTTEEITSVSRQPGEVGEAGEFLDVIRKFTESFKAAREIIKSMDDDSLIELYQQAKEISNVSWLIRAIVIGTAKSRARRGEGVVKSLAKEFGIGVRMAELDIQIYENFIRDNPDFEPVLPANFYTAALKAKDPQEAINYAVERRMDNPGWPALEFTRYVKGEMPKEKAPDGYYLLTPISRGEMDLMRLDEEETDLYAKISLISLGGSIYAEIK